MFLQYVLRPVVRHPGTPFRDVSYLGHVPLPALQEIESAKFALHLQGMDRCRCEWRLYVQIIRYYSCPGSVASWQGL